MRCLQLEVIASREDSAGGPGYITSIEALNTSIAQASQASQAAGTQVSLSAALLNIFSRCFGECLASMGDGPAKSSAGTITDASNFDMHAVYSADS